MPSGCSTASWSEADRTYTHNPQCPLSPNSGAEADMTQGPRRATNRRRSKPAERLDRSCQVQGVEGLQRVDVLDLLSFPVPLEQPHRHLVRREVDDREAVLL